MSFPFFDLLLDLQHCILEMCDPVSQYMFFCCSKASGRPMVPPLPHAKALCSA